MGDFHQMLQIIIKHQSNAKKSSIKPDKDIEPFTPHSPFPETDREDATSFSSETDVNAPEYPEGIQNNRLLEKYSHRALRLTQEEQLKETKMDQIKAYDPQKEKKTLVDLQPTYREIHQTLNLIKEAFPDKNVFRIIKILRFNLVHYPKAQNDTDSNFLEENTNDTNFNIQTAGIDGKTEPKMWQELREDTPLGKKKIPFKRFYTRDVVREKRFQNKEQQYRYRQKMMVAKAFVNKQYGLASLQAELAESQNFIIIKRSKYNALVWSALTDSYRNLEHFLIHECKKSIRVINKWEMSALNKILCNCRKKMKTQHSVTFLKFVSITFGLKSETISEEQATSLYIFLQNHLKLRIGTVQLDRIEDKMRWVRYQNSIRLSKFNRQEFNTFFNRQRELELIQTYLEIKEVGLSKTHFDNKYPEKKHLFTLDTIKERLVLVVRICFKRLRIMSEKYKTYNVPTFISMDGEDVRFIARSSDGALMRLQLLNFFFNPQNLTSPAAKLVQLITNVNLYVLKKQNEKFGKVIERRQPYTQSVISKVEYNVHLSREKLKETKRSYQPDQIFLKGKERNYQHFLNFENGESLHYYRKVDEEGYIRAMEPDEFTLFDHDADNINSTPNDRIKTEEKPKKEEAFKLSEIEVLDILTEEEQKDLDVIILGELNKYLEDYDPENKAHDQIYLRTITHRECEYEKWMGAYLQKLKIDFDKI